MGANKNVFRNLKVLSINRNIKERDQCFINYKSISVIKHYNFENVNIEYIAGLCDAEGCFCT